MCLDDGQGGTGLPQALKLQSQTLGQIPGSHTRRIQRLEQGEPLLQHRGGQPRRLGQIGHVVPEVAVLIQAGGQELCAPEDQGGGLAAFQLPCQMEEQGILQAAVRPHAG